jgi:hypothetical protein
MSRVCGLVPGGFARLPVRLEWSRKPDPYGLWEGRVQAEEEIVGLALALLGGRLFWHKTLRRGAWADDNPRLYVGFWISTRVGATVIGPQNVQLRLPGVAPAYLVRASSEAPFRIVESWSGETGNLVELVSIGGDAPLALGALFLARGDVKNARKGFWRVRPEIAEGVPGPVQAILKGPR